MAKKLSRKAFPSGHSSDDFECFGPSAVSDGEFAGTKIADMGCFMQEGVDSNKYYHASVVKSKKTGEWFVYVEYGRVGVNNPQYQFIQCSSESEAESEYTKILESKNVKRGTWENHKTLGKRLIPKVDSKGKPKDLYLVRPQATRSTGLPDAKTITNDDGLDHKKVQKNGAKNGKNGKKGKKAAKKDWADRETMSLMRDLNMGTINYTKATMADAAIPTQKAIDNGRAICLEALKRVKKVGDNVDKQVADRELKQLTRDMYSLIPKKKHRRDAKDTWILGQDNIQLWQQDLDAFESALYVTDLGDVEVSNPFAGFGIKMCHLPKSSDTGKLIHDWAPTATKNVHGWLGKMKLRNVWEVERQNEVARLKKAQEKIAKERWTCRERPLHQPKRTDLSRDEAKLYARSGTYLMFHGSRSVNVSGILREGFRLPRQLVGVAITGAMFGSGHYTADDWKKSAGYCSLGGSIYARGGGSVRGRHAFMLLCDVALGNMHVAPGCRGYTSAPRGYHSVFGKSGASGVMNNEFITYDVTQTKIRYVVEFDA